MKKEIRIAVLVSISLLSLTIVVTLLIVNSSYYSTVSNDGWASYIGNISGSFIGVFTSFAVLWITNKQTQRIEEINRKLQEDSLISNNYSDIRFNEEQAFVRKPNENAYFLKLKLYDEKNRPLVKLNINKIVLLRSKHSYYGYDEFEPIELCDTNSNIQLEYTPKQEKQNVIVNFYFGWVKLKTNIDEALDVDLYYRLDISMSIINIFGVEIKQDYFLLINQISKNKKVIDGKVKLVPETQLNGSGDYYHLNVDRQFTNFKEIQYRFNDNV